MGCEVLIVRTSKPGADEGMVWKRGDPVLVCEEGHVWGFEEDPATNGDKFVIITVSDVTVEQAKTWLESHLGDGEGNTLRLRLRRVIWNNLPQAVRDQLLATGRYTTTWVAIRNFIHNMQTGVPDLP